jgi:glutathione S-transferase
MLKLYHYPMSPNSRRVWVALLEKGIPFELVTLNLDGDQFQPDFLAMNPCHQIPVLVDDGFYLVESLAILDYLEAKYPNPALLPSAPKDLAIVRMVEMVTVNEVLPIMRLLFDQKMGIAEQTSQKLERTKRKLGRMLDFLERQLGDRSYFGGEHLTLADVVAGTVVPWFPSLGFSLDGFPKLNAWCDRLMQREAWQRTQPTSEVLEAHKSHMKAVVAQAQRN